MQADNGRIHNNEMISTTVEVSESFFACGRFFSFHARADRSMTSLPHHSEQITMLLKKIGTNNIKEINVLPPIVVI